MSTQRGVVLMAAGAVAGVGALVVVSQRGSAPEDPDVAPVVEKRVATAQEGPTVEHGGRCKDGEPPTDPLSQEIALSTALPYCAPSSSTPGHPGPQFRPPVNDGTLSEDGTLTTVDTSETCLPEPWYDPFTLPPGTNLLPNVYTNMKDGLGHEMPNTLPSTPSVPYNLHPDPEVFVVDDTSPTMDLLAILNRTREAVGVPDYAAERLDDAAAVLSDLAFAVDILEGNPLCAPGEVAPAGRCRSYDGMPLLHYKGPEKIASRENGRIVGNTVKVKQWWYDEHIESDTAFVDPTPFLSADEDLEWIIEYDVTVLDRGEDDFSPFAMFSDDPRVTDPSWDGSPDFNWMSRPPHVGFDQTFFPMVDGTRTVFRVKMPPARYWHLTYTWGWRMHPPRIQAVENSLKVIPPAGAKWTDTEGNPVPSRSLPDWERYTFRDLDEDGNEKADVDQQAYAISQIGDLSPAKRMWAAFNSATTAVEGGDLVAATDALQDAWDAYFDWRSRSRLPAGVDVDPESDLTILYVNNTIYAEFSDEGPLRFPEVRWPDWTCRDTTLKVTMHNNDYFQHAYMNVDFGGSRGWENQFKSSTKVGGSGCWFTFGRAHWTKNMNTPIVLAAADKSDPRSTRVHTLHMNYNFEPSTRLRFYQFDPIHHDVAIYSVH